MVQKKWIYTLIGAFVVDTLAFAIYLGLYFGGFITTRTGVILNAYFYQGVSFLMKSVFFIIIIYTMRFRKLLFAYGIVSTLALFCFMGYFLSTTFGYQTYGLFNTLSVVFASASLVIAFIYAVDPTTTNVFRIVMLTSSLYLIILKTPVYTVMSGLLIEFWRVDYSSAIEVFFNIQLVQIPLFGLLTAVQCLFVAKLDFV